MESPVLKRKSVVKPVFIGGGVVLGAGLIIFLIAITRSGAKTREQAGEGSGNISPPKDSKCPKMVVEFEELRAGGAPVEQAKALYDKGLLECTEEFSKLKNPTHTGSTTNNILNNIGSTTNNILNNTGSTTNNILNNTGSTTNNILNNTGSTTNNHNNPGSTTNNPNNTGPTNNNDNTGSTTNNILNNTGPNSNNNTNSNANNSSANDPVQAVTQRKNFIKEINKASKDPNGPLPTNLKPLQDFLIGEGITHNSFSLLKNSGHFKDYSDPFRAIADRGGVFLKTNYDWNDFLHDFMKAEIIKAVKAENETIAKKYYDLYHMCYMKDNYFENRYHTVDPFEPRQTNNIDELNDVKFWKAIVASEWGTAAALLEKKLFLPTFLCEIFKADVSRLQLLQELSPDQMDALMDLKRCDEFREYSLNYYLKFPGCEELVEKYAADYEKAVEQMELLKLDIHSNFDFKVPPLPELKTKMQEIRDYFESNVSGSSYESALQRLESDPKRNLNSIVVLAFGIEDQAQRSHLFEEFMKIKYDMATSGTDGAQHKFDLEFLKAFKHLEEGSFTNFACSIKKALVDYSGEFLMEDKVVILKNAEKAFSTFGTFYQGKTLPLAQIYVCFADFWASFLSYLTTKSDEDIKVFAGIDAFDIEAVGQLRVDALLPKSLKLLQNWSQRPEATEADETEYNYASDYVQVYNAMNGISMHKLWNGWEGEVESYFQSVPVTVAKSLLDNRQKLTRLGRRGALYEKVLKRAIKGMNSTCLEELDRMLSALNFFGNEFELKNCNTLNSIFNSSALTSNTLSASLESFAIRDLRNDLCDTIYIDWEGDNSSAPVSFDAVRNQFDTYKSTKAQEDRQNLLTLAKNYILTLKKDLHRKISSEVQTKQKN